MAFAPGVVRGIVEIICVLLMGGGLFTVLWHRMRQGRGLSQLAVQFTWIIFVFPTILILSLEDVIKGELASTLIGALAGYLFSEFGKTPRRAARAEAAEAGDDPR